MGLNIGRLLYGIRTKYEMNVKDICRGICGVHRHIVCMKMVRSIPDILLGKYVFGQDGIWNIGIDGLYF